jgi:hypothetical protein
MRNPAFVSSAGHGKIHLLLGRSHILTDVHKEAHCLTHLAS